MGAAALSIELIGVFALSAYLLWKYSDFKRQTVIVSVSVLIGWFLAFTIVFILPLDVALTFYNQCAYDLSLKTTPTPPTTTTTIPLIEGLERMRQQEQEALKHPQTTSTLAPTTTTAEDAAPKLFEIPANASIVCDQPKSYVPPTVLPGLWRFVYWTSQLLTWIVLPLMQSYATAGEFTVAGKLRTAAKENAIYYGTYLIIFVILLIYIAAKGFSLNFDHLKVVCITASNTWGMFWLVLLLGYGLVEVPRKIWQSGGRGALLQRNYFDLDKQASDMNDADETIRELYRDASALSAKIKGPHALRPSLDVILKKFPESIKMDAERHEPTVGRSGASSVYRDADASSLPDEAGLVRLHQRVIKAAQEHDRTNAQWEALMANAMHLEDVSKAELSGVRRFEVQTHPLLQIVCTPHVAYLWYCVLRRPLLRSLGLAMMMMTAYIVWSEVTFFNKSPVLSLAAVFVRSAASGYNYTFIELSSVITIAYMCLCAYSTVFRIKVYRFYHLDSHHKTDEKSLLFSAILLCRLTPPLCLNFLGLIHLDSHIVSNAAHTETAYTQIMGHLDVISFISNGFNIYFPMAILVLCIATYARLGTRLLQWIGIDQFMTSSGGSDDMTHDMVNAGKALVQNERNRRGRERERNERSQYWQEKLGGRQEDAAAESGRLLDGGEGMRTSTMHRMEQKKEMTSVDVNPFRDAPSDEEDLWRSPPPPQRRQSGPRPSGSRGKLTGEDIFGDL